MEKTFTVYGPSGTAEEHTLANARDLVQGAGYSWEKGKDSQPAAVSPHRNKKIPSKSIAEEVFGRVGAQPRDGNEDGAGAEVAETTTPDPEDAPEATGDTEAE